MYPKEKTQSGIKEPKEPLSDSSEFTHVTKKHFLKEYSEGDQLIIWEPSILQQFENQWQLGYPAYMPTNSLFDQPFKSSGANIGTFGFFHSKGLKPL